MTVTQQRGVEKKTLGGPLRQPPAPMAHKWCSAPLQGLQAATGTCPGWFGLVGTKPAPSTGPHWLCLGGVGGGQNGPRGGQGWGPCATAPPGHPWLGHGQRGAKGVAWGGRGGVQTKFRLTASEQVLKKLPKETSLSFKKQAP